jgi:hypothetical protein
MIPKTCIQSVAAATKLSQAQLQGVSAQLSNMQRQAAQNGGSPAASLQQAAQMYAGKAQLAAVIAKRNAALNAVIYQRLADYVKTTWSGREAEGLRAVLTGSVEGRRGARASAANEQKVLTGTYWGQLTTELERAGVFQTFKTGTLDREVARALWAMNSQTPNLKGLPADAVAIAKAVHRVQEVSRTDANKAGAWIGKLEGYVVRQSHDPWKITRTSANDWAQYVLQRLDWARIEAQTGPINNKIGWLEEVHTSLASGAHLKSQGATSNNGFKGPGNLAKRMSEERVLHFKDADAWFDYNEKFGAGNMREAVVHGLRSSAQNTGLMRVLGPNPEAMFNRVSESVQAQVRGARDAKRTRALAAAVQPGGWLANRLGEVQGTSNIAANVTAARIGSNIRAFESMAKLGGAMLSSVTDIANYASEMSFQGQGFLSGIGEAVGAIGKGRPKGEQAEILSSLGVFFDHIVGDLTRTGSLDESFGGWTSRAMQHYFRFNGLNWWTDTLRGSAALSMSHNLAIQAGKSFDQLAPELQHTLGLFDIAAADWDHIRTNGLHQAADGRTYITADRLDEKRADQMRQYIVDRANTAVLEPDADARAMLRQGTRPGTMGGELARFVAQFKGFPVAYTRQVLGREIYGRGAKPFADGAVRGIAQLIVATTVLGYAAMAAKDLAKGRTPRNPLDPKTIAAAMTQGGGAGIYGDFLFGEYTRFGRTPLETLAGPTLGTGAEAIALWSGLWRGKTDAGDALRFGLANTPFLNLFYTRVALDYLILYQVQEAVSPARCNGWNNAWNATKARPSSFDLRRPCVECSTHIIDGACMTISSQTGRQSYAGNGVTISFPVPFKFFNNADVTVILQSALGVDAPLTEGIHYTLSGAGDEAGGEAVLATAPAVGENLSTVLDPLLLQSVDYVSNDPFPAETHERALDRLTQMMIRTRDLVARTFRVPDGDTSMLDVLPGAAARANKYLTFDNNGDPEVAATLPSGTLSQSVIAQFLTPQTAQEVAAVVTPTSYVYRPGDVRRYGADVSGVSDSKAAFQAALNTGHVVSVPAGTYRLLSAVSYTGRVVIHGDGAVSRILCDSDAFTITNGTGSCIDNLYLENITAPWIITRNPSNWAANISGTLAQSNGDGYQPTSNDVDIWSSLSAGQKNQQVGPRIYFAGNSQNINVSRIYGRFVLIELYDTQNSCVRDCDFRAGKGFAGGILFWNVDNQEGRFNRAINNHVSYSSFSGIAFARNDDFLAEGNVVEHSQESGIKTFQGAGRFCHNGTIIGNKSNRNYTDGFDTASNFPLSDSELTSHLVVGNESFGNGGTGMNADGQLNAYIGNKFWNNYKYGFWGLCSKSLISGNYLLSNNVIANATYHELLGGNENNLITGNFIRMTNGGISAAIYAHNVHLVTNNYAIGGSFDFGTRLGTYENNIDFSTGFPTEQSFVFGISNNAGTLQHTIYQQSGATATGNFHSKITGASATPTNTPTGADSSTAMVAGGKIGATSTEVFWFNTASQVAANAQLMANIIYNDTATSGLYVRPQIVQININGVDQPRLRLQFMTAAGAAFALTTANIAAGKTIQVQFLGRIA